MPNTKKVIEKQKPDVQRKLEENIQKSFSEFLTKAESHAWEFGLSYQIKSDISAEKFKEIFEKLKSSPEFSFEMLIELTAIDWLDKKEERFEVVYHLHSLCHGHRLCLRKFVSEESPNIPSVLPIWRSANFMEREVWDMYGISFEGHGDLRRILMYDEFVGHPLRKDYPKGKKQPRVKLRIPELRNTSSDMKREALVSLPSRQRA